MRSSDEVHQHFDNEGEVMANDNEKGLVPVGGNALQGLLSEFTSLTERNALPTFPNMPVYSTEYEGAISEFFKRIRLRSHSKSIAALIELAGQMNDLYDQLLPLARKQIEARELALFCGIETQMKLQRLLWQAQKEAEVHRHEMTALEREAQRAAFEWWAEQTKLITETLTAKKSGELDLRKLDRQIDELSAPPPSKKPDRKRDNDPTKEFGRRLDTVLAIQRKCAEKKKRYPEDLHSQIDKMGRKEIDKILEAL